MTLPTKIPSTPVERWQAAYAQDPLRALDRLLTGRVFLGRLHRNDADEIIFRLFHTASDEDRTRLDETLQRWFATNWGQAPPDLSVSRWDQVLQNAFSVAVRLTLQQTQTWLLDHRDSGRRWLRTLYLDASRDPEAAFLRTLALSQRDTRLLPSWMALCRMDEDRPLYFGGLALLGLRKLPDENGQPHSGIHPAVFRGIVELANALDRQVRPRKDGERYWLVEMRAFMVRYPRSQTYWAEHFWPHLRYHRDSAAAVWLGKLIHPLKRALEGGRLRSTGYSPARSPSKDDTDTIVDLLRRKPLDEVRLTLTNFLQKHRVYAEETGNADVLVKVFGRIVSILWRQDTVWALGLIQEAFDWAPYNPFNWAQLATLEARVGNQKQALRLLWKAKRRFPDDAFFRTQLADLLMRQKKYEVAELVYREAKEHFPDDAVCRTGLAEVLKAQGKLKEAEVEYREAKANFPDDAVCRNGLAEVLKAQGRFEGAEAEYRETKVAFPDNKVCRTGLAEVLKAQRRYEEAEAEYRETKANFPEDVFCRTGLAMVLVLQGRWAESIRELEETVRKFPNDKSPREFLEKVKAQEMDAVALAYKAMSEEAEEASLTPQIKRKFRPSTVESAEPAEADEEIDAEVEADLGLAAVYRFAALQAEGKTKVRYWQTAEEASERALTADPGNLYALLGRGFGMLHTAPEDAEGYFTHQIEEGKREHVAGFQLGRVQARMQRGETVPAETWEALRETFENQRTLITLEEARHGLHHRNGITQPALEELRKHLRSEHAVETLPRSLQNLDKWVREIVKTRMFAGVALARPLTEKEVAVIAENVEQHGAIVQGVVEHSLSVFE